MACATGVCVSDECVNNEDISHNRISVVCISDNQMRDACISDDHISDISHRRTLHSCTSVESKSSGSKSWPALESGRVGGGGGFEAVRFNFRRPALEELAARERLD